MANVFYSARRVGAEWEAARDGALLRSYLTQEAAFEAAVAAAGADLRSGHSVTIDAPSATAPQGARTGGGDPVAGDGFS